MQVPPLLISRNLSFDFGWVFRMRAMQGGLGVGVTVPGGEFGRVVWDTVILQEGLVTLAGVDGVKVLAMTRQVSVKMDIRTR